MAVTGITPIGRSIVLQDTVYSHRWYDAIGPACQKVLAEFVRPYYLAASNIGGWTTTLVNASTHALVAGALGGNLLITTAALENDGAQLQVSAASFLPLAANRIYFGCKFQVSAATESDFLVGLTVVDTTAIGGVTDGIYFRKIDGTAVCNFVIEGNAGTETETAALTVVAATDYILEWIWDGTYIQFYVDGVLGGAPVLTNIPTANYLTPTIAYLTGAAAAITMTVDWLRCIQID
jgi:hypothetical protein